MGYSLKTISVAIALLNLSLLWFNIGSKVLFYLLTHITRFNLRLYDIGHMVKDHSDSERGNLLLPLYGLFFPISSMGSFICTIPQTG